MTTDGLTIEWETTKFERFVRELLRGVEHEMLPKVIRKVALDFLAGVIPRTPVDTGRARAGWVSYVESHGQMVQITGPNVTAEAIAQGKEEGSFREQFTRREAFVEIINAVEYIVILEYGHSDQQPAGMMRITFREIQAGQDLTKELAAEFRKQIREADRKAGRTTSAALARRGEAVTVSL